MLKFAANITMMFTEVSFLERFKAAADAGFKGVEYLTPYDYPKEVIKEKLNENNLKQVLFNMPPGDWAAGERGLATLPDRKEEFKEGVALAIDYAKTLGADQVHMMAGIPPKDRSETEITTLYINNAQYAADQCQKAGLNLMIEPINQRDMPGYYLSTQRQAETLLQAINRPNIFTQLDFYHCQIAEGDLIKTFDRLGKLVGHIQIASVPERHEPNQGEINYAWILQHLEKQNYQGWIGCEYHPEGDTVEGLTWWEAYR